MSPRVIALSIVEWASNRSTSDTEVKRKTQNERDAAKMRINLHKRRCSSCSHSLNSETARLQVLIDKDKCPTPSV
jgi:hypothetical protein